jgi:hypothetical protein
MATNDAELRRRVALLENSPAMKQLLAEEDAKRLQTRQAAVARLALAEKAIEMAFPGLEAEVTAREAELVAHDAARPGILEKMNAARVALMTARMDTDQVRIEVAGVLDPVLTEAITFFREASDTAHRIHLTEQKVHGEKNLYTELQKVTIFNNISAKTAAMTYSRNAVHELEGMKLMAVPDLERIAELKRNMPDAKEITGITIDQKIPADHIPSMEEILANKRSESSALDYAIVRKINEALDSMGEKAKKITERLTR